MICTSCSSPWAGTTSRPSGRGGLTRRRLVTSRARAWDTRPPACLATDCGRLVGSRRRARARATHSSCTSST
eukprot:scaffold49398_cov24-Phaeocystis_antarctica.AAC.1